MFHCGLPHLKACTSTRRLSLISLVSVERKSCVSSSCSTVSRSSATKWEISRGHMDLACDSYDALGEGAGGLRSLYLSPVT